MNLQDVIHSDITIPSTPGIMPKLQNLLSRPDSDSHDIGAFLKMDVGLTTKVMRMANSSFYALTFPAQSIEEAINFLGFREVYRIVSVAATEDIMAQPLPSYQTAEGELLEHSVATARLMARFAKRNGTADPDSYYTIGLLHAIGKLVIDQCLLAHGLSFYTCQTSDYQDGSLPTISIADEKALLGFTHVDAGAALLQQWKFPSDIIDPIRCQFQPQQANAQSVAAYSLALSRYLAPALLHADPELIDPQAFPVETESLVGAALNPSVWPNLLRDCTKDLEELRALLA